MGEEQEPQTAASAETPAPSGEPRAPRTDAELKQLAIDIYERKVITSHEVPENLLCHVFLVLLFADPKQFEGVSFVYEYLTAAGPRSINGWPIFSSCHVLLQADYARWFAFYDAYKKMKTEFLGDDAPCVPPANTG